MKIKKKISSRKILNNAKSYINKLNLLENLNKENFRHFSL